MSLFGESELTRVADFELREELGRGGMGVVFLGRDPALDRAVAVKVLHGASFRGDEQRASHRLVREARAMARLSHPNVVRIYEVGEHARRIFVAMEYIPGTTLAQWQRALAERSAPALRWREVLARYVLAGRGLAAAHDAGVVHRDFKPQNVLVGDDGRVCVTDFGLARTSAVDITLPEREGELVTRASASATSSGLVMGTPAYMSPEQIEGARVDARSDQFSFCVSLFQALHGARPFPAESLGERYEQIKSGVIARPPGAASPPAWLDAAITRGLAFSPGERWPSMPALLAELERDRETPRRRRAVVLGLVSAVVTIGLGGSWIAEARARTDAVAVATDSVGGLTPRAGDELRAEPIRPIPPRASIETPRARLEVALGRELFTSPQLSADGSISCLGCHVFERGGADPRARSVGVGGASPPVNAPSIFNLEFLDCYNWSGKECSLDEHALLPLHSPLVMANEPGTLSARLRQQPALQARFAALYPDGLTDANVARALAAYLRTLTTPGGRFDQFLRGDAGALSELERRGYALFKELGCASCHQGVAAGGNLYQRMGVVEDPFAGERITPADLGRYNVTKREEDRFVFRVAPLRNVAQTAPYFHDGSSATLGKAVQKMARYQLGRRLATAEVTALVAFLRTLSGEPPEAPA